MKKIAICGVHGVGKSKICKKIQRHLLDLHNWEWQDLNLAFIPEQFREVIKDLNWSKSTALKQTEEITLETYARQLALECRYKSLGKHVLCDRSVLDTFIYYDYFNKEINFTKNSADSLKYDRYHASEIPKEYNCIYVSYLAAIAHSIDYSKIYLIEPSDREIENDGFRLTDKKQQLEIHQLFLEYFKDFPNVEIINQEDAYKEEFIEKVAKELI